MTKKNEATQKGEAPKRVGRSKQQIEVADLKSWLGSLDFGVVKPTVHVNGHLSTSAFVTVDFGNPLKSVRLTSEQSGELTQRLSRAGREVYGKNGQIRVSADLQNGIYWAGIPQ